jgi:hypothetical protein
MSKLTSFSLQHEGAPYLNDLSTMRKKLNMHVVRISLFMSKLSISHQCRGTPSPENPLPGEAGSIDPRAPAVQIMVFKAVRRPNSKQGRFDT